MTRIEAKGVHRVKKRLAGGDMVQFHYAWRGGPRFWCSRDEAGEGSPDYWAAWQAACAGRDIARGTFRGLIRRFLASRSYTRLAERTRADIRESIFHRDGIDHTFGAAPVKVFDRREVRAIVYRWRDQFPDRTADKRVSHLRQIVAFGVDQGDLSHNHLADMERLYRSDRAEIIWRDEEIETFCKHAPEHISRILVAATETGLRPGDLAKLSRRHVQATATGRRITLRATKNKRVVSVPVTPRMASLVDSTPAGQMLLLCTGEGNPWRSANYLGAAVSGWRDRLGIRDDAPPAQRPRLYDARGTAATRLLTAGATLAEIAAAMGWSITTAARMIEVYAQLNPDASDGLLQKLVTSGLASGHDSL